MRYSDEQRARMVVPAISRKHSKYEMERTSQIRLPERLITTLAEKDIEVFRFEDAKRILQADSPTTSRVLGGLTRRRRVERIERGKYMFVPEQAGPDQHWTVDSWIVVPRLMEECYVGFITAMNYWNMTDQIPYTVFVASTKAKRRFDFGYMRYQFVKLSERKFFGGVERKCGKETFMISSREKTIVDGLMHPEYSGGMSEVSKAMGEECDNIDWQAVLGMADRVKMNVVLKRLGYLLSILEMEEDICKKIKKMIKKYPYQRFDKLGAYITSTHSKEYGLLLNYAKEDLLRWMEF
ncbi:transcriptional regulator [Cenarchaeum symbiosum A]|uniref:Transcriptional regulator n=1 Tax=Cenarchaeum symbiosum (strain A) TaxID=414004 RepID=A0RWF8_CENSY|nr:transcriptional regulator [Cenarchaeum symbiosum A]